MEVKSLDDFRIIPVKWILLLLYVDHGLVFAVGLSVKRGLVLEPLRRFLTLLVYQRELVDVFGPEAKLNDYIK